MEQQPAQEQPNVQSVAEPMAAKPFDDVEENKDMAALSYAWVLSLVMFFTKRESPFVRFHAKQGIVLFILSIVFWMIPFVGRLLELVVLGFCAFGFIAAAQGHWKELPFVGAIAKGDWAALRKTWRSAVDAVARAWHHFRKEPKQSGPVATAVPAQPESSQPIQAVPPTDVPPPPAV